jgi:Phage tail protein (Tail_P2_I)
MSSYGWAVEDVTQRLYDNLYPLTGAEARLGWPLLSYIDALGLMFQKGADLVQDGPNGEPGWSIILDINRCPDEGLPWLGQLIGMHFYQGIAADQMRQQIRDHLSWQRGTLNSIVQAIRLFLTGTQTVQITERDTSPYHFLATIWAAEAPSDTSATSPLVRYVNMYAKPAGLQWTLTVNPGTPPATTYGAIYTRGDTYLAIYNNFQRYSDIH